MSATLATNLDDKPTFNYQAFKKDLKGELYGVSHVVSRRLGDPSWHSKQIVQLSQVLKEQHAKEEKKDIDEEAEYAPAVEEVRKLRKEGLYSF